MSLTQIPSNTLTQHTRHRDALKCSNAPLATLVSSHTNTSGIHDVYYFHEHPLDALAAGSRTREIHTRVNLQVNSEEMTLKCGSVTNKLYNMT